MLLPVVLRAQHPATIREYEKNFTTYPFSEPDPVPNPTNIYPYFRFDGFTDKPEQQQWKVVELENDFIRVMIMPQIGGKVWTAIDKKNGQPFIYDNDAIKFRDIAMRGPWTSGGLEANFGIFGHTPGVATPVNYLTKKNADGSVSCVIGLLDLLTQTRWSMEINLPRDKAYFITRVRWHNATAIAEPYYSWMNLGEKVADSLEYIEPGDHYLGHDGSVHDWPYFDSLHKKISIYAQNDFGSYKSYHVTGVYSKYFGAFWQKENFGMIHYADREDKIGKKVWIWGLSPQGMIWEPILTDHSGQYTELQSGRLYNQNAPESVYSPFKKIDFQPYTTDTWSEYWYPFQQTGGVIAADLNGVFNLEQKPGSATVLISPVSYIRDTLKITDRQGRTLFTCPVDLQPLRPFQQSFPLKGNEKVAEIRLAGTVIRLQDSAARKLDRPLEPYPGFDWNSAYGCYLRGKYLTVYRRYAEAKTLISLSLKRDPAFVPALTQMAFLQYREMKDDSAFYYARTALSIDTYDPAANYYYGLSAKQLHKRYDAEDGFQVATITTEYRSAAFTQLSEMALGQGDYRQALHDAAKALLSNSENITALQLQSLSLRLLGRTAEAEKVRAHILELDPLNDFVRFESYWQHQTGTAKETFTHLIRDELPQQSYLDLAIWYDELGRTAESEMILQSCPEQDDEILYWLAYLHRNDDQAAQWLGKANAGDPRLVFPFRRESAAVMEWAIQQTSDWRPRYYLALIENFRDHPAKALQLLTGVKQKINFAPFFVTRARLRDTADQEGIEADYAMAAHIDQQDWRYGKLLANYYLSRHEARRALQTIKPYYLRAPSNYVAGMLYSQCLMENGDYATAEKVMDTIHILPFEGAVNGHRFYEQAKLMMALQALQDHDYKKALEKTEEAREWPFRLGVGAPYPDAVTGSLEDDTEQLIHKAMKEGSLSLTAIDRLKGRILEADRAEVK